MTETPQDTVDLIDQLNRDYETLHTEKKMRSGPVTWGYPTIQMKLGKP